MKNLAFIILTCFTLTLTAQQTVKSKVLKLKYTMPAGWNVQEFGSPASVNWEEQGNNLCKCSGILFFKSHADGKMNVLVYPSTQSGLDSAKRNAVGNLAFVDVQKYDKTKNKFFSFERKKSNFTDSKTKAKSYEVFRYFAKIEDHFYIIYAWQENMQMLNSTNEKVLWEMVNGIEPL
ncbi:MAG: hypothetical protein V4677_17775 [Bacteroidota bacterium]